MMKLHYKIIHTLPTNTYTAITEGRVSPRLAGGLVIRLVFTGGKIQRKELLPFFWLVPIPSNIRCDRHFQPLD